MLRVGSEWAMQRENVTIRQKVVNVLRLGDAFRKDFLRLRCKGEDFHAEGEDDSCRSETCVAESDDAESLSCKFALGSEPIAEILARLPFALANAFCMEGYSIGHVEKVSHRHLSYGCCTVSGYVGDDDATLACILQVNHVVSCGSHSDVSELRQLLHNLLGDYDLVGNDYLCISRTRDGFRGWGTVIDYHFTDFFQRLP